MEKSHIEKIEYILARSLFQKKTYDENDINNNKEEFFHYRNNLLELSEIGIETILSDIEEEERFFYNRFYALADFSFWSKAAYWTIDEAVALSFGRNPSVVNLESIKNIFIYSDDIQEEDGGGGAYQFYESVMPKLSPFYVKYRGLYNLVMRASEVGLLSLPLISPTKFIEWLKHIRFPVPQRLEAALRENGGNIDDWKTAFERLQRDSEAERAAAADEIAKLKAELENTLQQPETRQSEHPKAVKSMQKILLAVAVKKYHFKTDKRNSAASNITSHIQELGMNLDEDTVRKILQKSAEDLEFNSTD